MRQLTRQEIDQAPERFTYYCVKSNGGIHWQDKKECSCALPIPRKEFDIDEYDFSDTTICVANIGDEIIILQGEVHYDIVAESYVSLNKQDAIALAKHFKLTADDLR